MTTRYVALGPLLSGEGSRAFLGLRIVDGVASPCALVWAPEQVVCEPELVERLHRDTAHAERLRHPNIARVFGLIEVDEGLARVVEFADGESLRRILDVLVRLPSQLAARIVVDAALGVQYAHLTGNPDGTPLVHGDLRPETLLVSYAGVTKVTGYGALSVAPKEMGGNRVMGRRKYCAPEQILGGRYAVSPRTDVYLLGSLLYEAITGEIPFEGDKDFEHAVVTKEPLLLRSELVPPKLWPVIRKAMAKKANLRFETTQAFSEAVEEAVEGLPPRSELADFLERSFAGDTTRDARRRELEDGIQEWVLRQGLRLASPVVAMGPQPTATPECSPAGTAPASADPRPSSVDPGSAKSEPISSVPRPPLAGLERVRSPPQPTLAEAAPGCAAPVEVERSFSPSPRPVANVPRAPVPEGTAPRVERAAGGEPAPRSAGRGFPAWAAASLVVALASAAVVLRVSWQEAPPAQASPAASSQPEAALPADARHPPTPTAGARGAGENETSGNPAAGFHSRKADRAPTPIAKSTLKVVTEPPLAVAVDGKAVGSTPLEVPVKPGAHRVLLTDSKQGIELVHSIRAKPGPNRLVLKVGTGTVAVNAPSGCEVRIDGRLVGTAPLEGPVTVFEGRHRIQVSSGKARWQQAFAVTDGEKVNVDVHFEEPKAP